MQLKINKQTNETGVTFSESYVASIVTDTFPKLMKK